MAINYSFAPFTVKIGRIKCALFWTQHTCTLNSEYVCKLMCY